MKERLTAVLDGYSPLEDDLEAVADELESHVDTALAASDGVPDSINIDEDLPVPLQNAT